MLSPCTPVAVWLSFPFGRRAAGGRAPEHLAATHRQRTRPRCGSAGRLTRRIAEHTGQSVEQIATDFDRDRWFTAPEAVAYGLADEVIGGPAGAPESGTPA